MAPCSGAHNVQNRGTKPHELPLPLPTPGGSNAMRSNTRHFPSSQSPAELAAPGSPSEGPTASTTHGGVSAAAT
ncbi:unnamed protein product [Closterium sp. Naga37s-1]|nr:unnamed protein product [Closterium sp. Naga37s-1]